MASCQDGRVVISSKFSVKLVKWHVESGSEVRRGSRMGYYKRLDGGEEEPETFTKKLKLKSPFNGKILQLLAAEGDVVPARTPVALVEEVSVCEQKTVCEHKTVMKDLCCECGTDLRGLAEMGEPSSPTVPMIHNIPELRVTLQEAETLGKKDNECLIRARKLDLVVDLDQTLIHTTMELVPSDMKDVHHFRLPGHTVWYHTKIRPGAIQFLENVSRLYQLHIFTMGSRVYAHTIARILDPTQSLFAYRIRSRDECLSTFSKSHDLGALFPHGDSMVCIIDDREDVWNFAPNLIRVKPYQFFRGVGDINAPPKAPLAESDHSPGQGDSNDKQNTGTEESTSGEKGPARTINLNKGRDAKRDQDNCVSDSEEESMITKMETEDNVGNSTGSIDGSKMNNGPSVVYKKDEETVEASAGNDVNKGFREESCEGGQSRVERTKELTNGGEMREEQDQSSHEKAEENQEEVTREKNEKPVDDPKEKEKDAELREREKRLSYEIEDNDDYLVHLEDILHRIHDLFYTTLDGAKAKDSSEATYDPALSRYCALGTYTPDTKAVVPELKKGVLCGANLTFTGVVPTNVRSEDSQAWREARALGATVSDRVIRPRDTDYPSDVTTHVIAARLGTQKAYVAVKSPGMKLVNPEWLNCCAERWEWVDERLFPVEGAERYKEHVSGQRTPRGNSRGGTPQPTANETTQEPGSCSEGGNEVNENSRRRSDSVSSADLLMSSLKPLLSLSLSEVQAMDKEVEDLMNSSSGDESEPDLLGSVSDLSSLNSSSRSSSSSLGVAHNITDPENKRKRPRKEKEKDSSDDCDNKRQRDSNDYTRYSDPSDDDDDDDDGDDDMAALLEAELIRD